MGTRHEFKCNKKEADPDDSSKDFVLLLFIMFVGSTGQQFFQSIMTKYAVSLNCPEALVGIVVTAYAVMVFISSLISGVVSDRMQKKTLLIISIAGQALSTIGYAIIGESLVLLLAIRMVHGFCFGLNMVVTMSMVSFFLPREVLGVGMGVYGLGQTLAMGIGPSIGLSLVNSVGYRNMFLIAFVFTFSNDTITIRQTDTDSEKGAIQVQIQGSDRHEDCSGFADWSV